MKFPITILEALKYSSLYHLNIRFIEEVKEGKSIEAFGFV
jgi:hypothetical protein